MRTQISAQRSQADDGATQPVPDVNLTANNIDELTQTICGRCKLTFKNHELLFEHYRTSSFHYDCVICFQVFPKKKALKKASLL
jgi:mRNA-degrading endonuclease YafQ of YafQ-DinJ toxin-antitoxin module